MDPASSQARWAPVALRLAQLPGANVELFQDADRGIYAVRFEPHQHVSVEADWCGDGERVDLNGGWGTDGPATLDADELRKVAATLLAIADALTPAATAPARPARPPEP